MMRTTPHSKIPDNALPVSSGVTLRFMTLLLFAALIPLGLIVAGLIWLEDGGPVLTRPLLSGPSEASQIPSFRVATLHLEKWDIRQLPASMGNPERLILIPTLTVIGRFLTVMNLDRLPALLPVALGKLSPSVVYRPRSIYSN